MSTEQKSELARRPATTTALATTGSSHDPAEIGRMLETAGKQCHLVAPATSVGSLPEGYEVALSAVQIDATSPGETYAIAGKQIGLGKSALDRIAAAAGVSWDPQLSRRMDDGRDPHYCTWRAVGTYRHWDDSPVYIIGEKEMDLREGSAQVEALWERYRTAKEAWDAGRRGERQQSPKSPEGQIREMRMHIASHAETKARLRAIRSLGIKTSYTAAELAKPFVVARLVWTGRTDDPQLAREFALLRAQARTMASAAIYGALPVPAPMPPPLAPSPPALPAPPLEQSRADDSEPGIVEPTPSLTSPPAEQPSAESSAPPGEDVPVVPFGKNQGRPLAELSSQQLQWYVENARKALDDPKRAKWRNENMANLALFEAEVKRREQTGDRGCDPEDY